MWTKANMILSFISAYLVRLYIGLNLFPFIDNANFFVLGVRAKFLHHSKLERNVYKNRWQNVKTKYLNRHQWTDCDHIFLDYIPEWVWFPPSPSYTSQVQAFQAHNIHQSVGEDLHWLAIYNNSRIFTSWSTLIFLLTTGILQVPHSLTPNLLFDRFST